MNNLFKNNNLLIFYVLLSYLLRCPATEVLESSPLGENRGQTPKFPFPQILVVGPFAPTPVPDSFPLVSDPLKWCQTRFC